VKTKSLIYPGCKVAVMGLGISGRAAVRYALACGAEVIVSDLRSKERFFAEEAEFLSQVSVEWEAGGHSHAFLRSADLLLVSPGVNLHLPLITSLRGDGVKVAGEFAVAAGRIEVPVVAVSGTNGKTTVTTLIGEILKAAGKKVFVGGNIGTPLYEYLLEPAGYDMVVVETSSFQLESAGDFAPDVGLLLNITPDHLDRHGTMENYVKAKMQLFRHQRPGNTAIVNGDDPFCKNLPEGIQSAVRTFGKKDGCTALIGRNRITIGAGCDREDYPLEAVDSIGDITLMNYAAAILAVRSLGCSRQQTGVGLAAFHPLPHRIEFVAEINGVRYFNDSKATNTGAVIGALAQFPSNVLLLAGGRDKGDNYRLLRESVSGRVKSVLVLGEAAPLIAEALSDMVEIVQVKSMEDAVQTAAAKAVTGDVVLLSPACASFDMFTSYGHRGNEFKKAVLALQSSPGMTGQVEEKRI